MGGIEITNIFLQTLNAEQRLRAFSSLCWSMYQRLSASSSHAQCGPQLDASLRWKMGSCHSLLGLRSHPFVAASADGITGSVHGVSRKQRDPSFSVTHRRCRSAN